MVAGRRNIDPLKVASGLWQESRERYRAASEAALSRDAPEGSTDQSAKFTT